MSASAQMDAQTWAPSFRAHPELAKAMKLVGIDAVITANNHALDTGSQGLRDTLKILRQNNLHAVGTGNYLTEAREPVILERSQIKIGVLAYTEPENSLMGYATETKAGVAPLNLKHIQADIEKL